MRNCTDCIDCHSCRVLKRDFIFVGGTEDLTLPLLSQNTPTFEFCIDFIHINVWCVNNHFTPLTLLPWLRGTCYCHDALKAYKKWHYVVKVGGCVVILCAIVCVVLEVTVLCSAVRYSFLGALNASWCSTHVHRVLFHWWFISVWKWSLLSFCFEHCWERYFKKVISYGF